jgi:hypothetical protein
MQRRLLAIALTATLAVAGASTWLFLPTSRDASDTSVDHPVALSAAAASPIGTVFVVMMENTDWSSVKGSSSWPYFNSLLPTGASAESYRSGNHPSLPNYVMLEAGQNFGETNGSYLPQDHPISSDAHLATQLRAANVDWKYWAEDLPGNGQTCNTTDPGTPYSLDHNAQVYFDDVRNDPAYCIAHERPYSELAGTLAANTVSGYNLIVPNDYHQGEKLAPGVTDKHRQADDWLSHEIPMLTASAAYDAGAPILILWDESAGTNTNPSGLLVLGKYAKVGYSNSVLYSHGSTLRTMQEIFGVGPFLGSAATATDLSDLLTVSLGSGTSPPTDTHPPTAPSGVTATVNGPTQVTVTWSAATDDVGVASYRVMRGTTVVAPAVTGLSFVDTTVTPGSTNTYTVYAVDAAGNLSPASGASAPVTTPASTPSSPVAVDAVGGGTTASTNASSLSWTHTTATGANLLLVAVEFNDGHRSVSGVKYAGRPMTRVSSSLARSGTTTSDRHVEVWKLTDPPVGSSRVAVTLTGGTASITGQSQTFTHVNVTTSVGTAVARGARTPNPSVTVSSTLRGLVFTAVSTRSGPPTPPSGAISPLINKAGAAAYGGAAALPGDGRVTATWTAPAGADAVTAVPINPQP